MGTFSRNKRGNQSGTKSKYPLFDREKTNIDPVEDNMNADTDSLFKMSNRRTTGDEPYSDNDMAEPRQELQPELSELAGSEQGMTLDSLEPDGMLDRGIADEGELEKDESETGDFSEFLAQLDSDTANAGEPELSQQDTEQSIAPQNKQTNSSGEAAQHESERLHSRRLEKWDNARWRRMFTKKNK